MTRTLPFDTIASIIKCSKRSKQHFFSPDTMTFFNSEIHDEIFHGQIFITSESNFQNDARFWTIRLMDNNTGKVSTLSEFQQFDSLDRAREAAQGVENCDNCGVWVLPGDGIEVDIEPARFGMEDPYPGYSGDVVCRECAGAE